MPNWDLHYKNMIEENKLRKKFKYQLTKWFADKGELDEVVEQIEAYEGEGEGCYIGERDGKWAVFTEGSMVVGGKEFKSYKNLERQVPSLLQYRDMVRLAKRGA